MILFGILGFLTLLFLYFYLLVLMIRHKKNLVEILQEFDKWFDAEYDKLKKLHESL